MPTFITNKMKRPARGSSSRSAPAAPAVVAADRRGGSGSGPRPTSKSDVELSPADGFSATPRPLHFEALPPAAAVPPADCCKSDRVCFDGGALPRGDHLLPIPAVSPRMGAGWGGGGSSGDPSPQHASPGGGSSTHRHSARRSGGCITRHTPVHAPADREEAFRLAGNSNKAVGSRSAPRTQQQALHTLR